MDEREVTDAMIDAAIEALGPCVGSCGEASPPQRCDIRDAIEAALAARRTTPDREAWQPIETAPKDGKRVLVFEPGSRGGVWVAHFLRYPGKPDQWVNPGCHKITPSHWMPLPTAPTSDKGD